MRERERERERERGGGGGLRHLKLLDIGYYFSLDGGLIKKSYNEMISTILHMQCRSHPLRVRL